MDFVVGTFNTPEIYTLTFHPPTPSTCASLRIKHISPALGNHSWLALNAARDRLYATVWGTPPSIAAYAIDTEHAAKLINDKPVRGRSGYVAVSNSHVYSAGGATGEAFTLRDDGGVDELVQELSFLDGRGDSGTGGAVPHGDFGGLRHGAHSVDLAPDGKSLYVADIGRNCIWTFAVNDETTAKTKGAHLTLGTKHISPRSNDGPRHTTPHPNGHVLYSLQEHSSMVDAFSVGHDGVTLRHEQGVKIIPANRDPKDYWADEVRVGCAGGATPKYLYASTRGLEASTMGYVAVFRLKGDGMIDGQALHIFETPTSGGIANAVEPAPALPDTEVEYMALTDSQEGWVFVLAFDGHEIQEVARVKLEGSGEVVAAATAVWL